MLVGFSCKNYSSYKDEAHLSMMSSKKKEFVDFNTFETKVGRLLKNILIYGANASGKTNLLKSLSFMKNMVLDSVISSRIIKLNEQFKFSIDSQNEPTEFEIAFIADEILYTYGFTIFENKVNKEWLYRKREKNTLLFERKSSSWDTIILYGDMKKAKDIKKNTREDSLFITTASMLNIDIAKTITEWFSKLEVITWDNSTPAITVNYFEENSSSKNTILKYLKKADLGIDDFEINIKELSLDEDYDNEILKQKDFFDRISDNAKFEISKRSVEIQTLHKIFNLEGQVSSEISLPFFLYQSKGTIKFFELLGPILNALDNGSILVIDEIDSRLHCALVRFIISLFNSIDNNNKNAQLICSTHDVLLLEEDIRRDQIWFVEKNKFGQSELFSLDDFKNVRKNDAILKKYLLGVYGAVPGIMGSDFNE